MPEWGWYVWMAGGAVSFAALETWGKCGDKTLSATLEAATSTPMRKGLAFAGMLGFVGWFSVHLGLI